LFLELEPQLRDIIFKFYESKYASCLKLLDEIKVRSCEMPLFLPQFFNVFSPTMKWDSKECTNCGRYFYVGLCFTWEK
jgi:hypothetical protein